MFSNIHNPHLFIALVEEKKDDIFLLGGEQSMLILVYLC